MEREIELNSIQLRFSLNLPHQKTSLHSAILPAIYGECTNV